MHDKCFCNSPLKWVVFTYLSPFLFAFPVNWYSEGKFPNFLLNYVTLISFIGSIISPLVKEMLKKGSNGSAYSIEKITPTNYGHQKTQQSLFSSFYR